MSNAKSKQAKPKTGLARCMELASDRKGLVFLAAVLSSLAAVASFIPYIAVYFMIRSIIGVFPNLDQLDIPYTAQMIATLTRHQIGTVERALEIFRQLGLVEQLDSGAFYMTDIELMIGQSSTEAERKRAARLENKALLPPRTKGGHLSDIRPPEIEIELEKEIEIEKEREGETGHPAPAAYGRYNNVILTDTELSGLKTELPDKWEYYLDRLSCHIASTGKQYHSHAATIYKWAQEDAAKGKAAPKQGIPDYSCKEGESL